MYSVSQNKIWKRYIFVFPNTTNHLCERLHRVDFLKETVISHRFSMALLDYLGSSSFGKNSNKSSAEFHLPQGKGNFSSFLAQAVGSHHLLSVSVHMRQECTGMELVAAGPGPHSSPHPSTPLAPVPLVGSLTPRWVFLLSLMMQMLSLDHSCGDAFILGHSASH